MIARRRRDAVLLAGLALAASVLLIVELAAGALQFGERLSRDPCSASATAFGRGVDATIQRIALDGLDGAACELGTTREELVLWFDEDRRGDVPWTRETLEAAVREGMLEAIDRAEQRGAIGTFEARVLEEAVRRAPLEWLIEGGDALVDLLRLSER